MPMKNEPRVLVDIPGYWFMSEEDKELLDNLMLKRRRERDAKLKASPEPPAKPSSNT
jgi:hypothetical protein